MDTINFSLMQMFVNSGIERFVTPTFDTFKSLPQNDFIIKEGCFYEVNIENKENYLWLYFDYGKTKPRDKNVTNINTRNKKNNQRGIDEVELLNQIFCLYYYANNTLYLSNIKQKKVVEDFLKTKLNLDVNIKHFYKNTNEFIKIIESVGKIKFTFARNLFNSDSRKRQALIDLTGTDAPESFTIEAEYKDYKIKNFILRLFESQTNNEIQDLVICGIDDEKFNVVYNSDSFTKKIDVLCEKIEETGKFNGDFAKKKILDILKR